MKTNELSMSRDILVSRENKLAIYKTLLRFLRIEPKDEVIAFKNLSVLSWVKDFIPLAFLVSFHSS